MIKFYNVIVILFKFCVLFDLFNVHNIYNAYNK